MPQPRQCLHKTRVSTPLPFGERPACPFNRHYLPLHLHFHPNPSPQTLLKLRPYAPQTIPSFSLPVLQAGLGYVYILAHSQPTAARARSRGSGIPLAPDIHEGISVLGVHVGFTDAQKEGD